ncbi:hypothetical protein N7470_002340 [Penicillium chermesinum]|nr:hypothetical protein N7470_002340 [Penicillium chermesinum]
MKDFCMHSTAPAPPARTPHRQVLQAIASTVSGLRQLTGKLREADLTIQSLIQELNCIRTALSSLKEWLRIHRNGNNGIKSDELDHDLAVAMDGCREIMEILYYEVFELVQCVEESGGLGFKTRIKVVWNDESMRGHQEKLRAQVQALQLLLQVCQCHSSTEQVRLLRRATTRQIIGRVADDTATLRSGRMSRMGSISRVGSDLDNVSESSSRPAISHRSFDFDASVMNSPVYLRAVQQWTSSHLPLPSPREDFPKEPSISAAQSRRSDTDEGYDSFASGSIHQGHFDMSQSQGDLLALPDSPSGPIHSRSVSHTQALQRPPANTMRRNLSESQYRPFEDGASVSPLIKAAQGGTRTEVERLLEHGYDIEERHNASGRNALLVAAHCGKEDIVDLLIQCGARLKVTDGSGETALHLAASRGHWEVIKLLVTEKSLIEIQNFKGRTALRVAADHGQPEAVQVLLENNALVNARAENQMTALHAAAKRGDHEIVQLLISHGADIEAKDGSMMTALHYACEEGNMEVVRTLLDSRANLEAPGRDRKNPLICAAQMGRTQVVEYLVKRKASTKSADDSGMSALHWASYNGHEDTVRLLSERKGALETVNNMGRTALHLAVMQSQFAVVELLQRKGVQLETRCHTGLTALHYACMANSFEITRLLLLSGADIEASESEHQQRPLHIAAGSGSTYILDLLCDKGASLHARNGIGDRPLCVATRFGHAEVVQKLLDRGSPISEKFELGFREDSPLCLAAMKGHLNVAALLIERGANVLKEDELGWQPIRYAAYYGHPEVLELLLSNDKIPPTTLQDMKRLPETIGFSAQVPESTKRQVQAIFLQTCTRPMSFGQTNLRTIPNTIAPAWNMRDSLQVMQQQAPAEFSRQHTFEAGEYFLPELPGSLEIEHHSDVETAAVSKITTSESDPPIQQPRPISGDRIAAILNEPRGVSPPIIAQPRRKTRTRNRSRSHSREVPLVSATYTPIAIPYHTKSVIMNSPEGLPKPVQSNPTAAEQTPRTLPLQEYSSTEAGPRVSEEEHSERDSDSDSISSVYTAPDGEVRSDVATGEYL